MADDQAPQKIDDEAFRLKLSFDMQEMSIKQNLNKAANQKGEPGDKWKGAALQTRIDATENDPRARAQLVKEFAYSQFSDIGVLDSDYINES